MRWFVIIAVLFASGASAQTPECKSAKKELTEREEQLTTLKKARKDMRDVVLTAKKGRAHSRALDSLEKADDAMEDAVKRATAEQTQRDKLTKEICK